MKINEISKLAGEVEHCLNPMKKDEYRCSNCAYAEAKSIVTCRVLFESVLEALKEFERYKRMMEEPVKKGADYDNR